MPTSEQALLPLLLRQRELMVASMIRLSKYYIVEPRSLRSSSDQFDLKRER